MFAVLQRWSVAECDHTTTLRRTTLPPDSGSTQKASFSLVDFMVYSQLPISRDQC